MASASTAMAGVDGKTLGCLLEQYSKFYDWAPVGFAEFATQTRVNFTVVCEKNYSDEVRVILVNHFKKFFSRADSGVSSLHLDLKESNDGDFQLVLSGFTPHEVNVLVQKVFQYTMANTAPVHQRWGLALPLPSSYSYRTDGDMRTWRISASARAFGTAQVVTFTAHESCPWRVFLELYRLFDDDAQRMRLGLGKAEIVNSVGVPSRDEYVWKLF